MQALLPEIWELKTENRELRLRLSDAAPLAAWPDTARPRAAGVMSAAGGGVGRGAGVDGRFLFGGADGSLSSGLFRRAELGGSRAEMGGKQGGEGGAGGRRGQRGAVGFAGEREADVRMQELVAGCRDLEVCARVRARGRACVRACVCVCVCWVGSLCACACGLECHKLGVNAIERGHERKRCIPCLCGRETWRRSERVRCALFGAVNRGAKTERRVCELFGAGNQVGVCQGVR